MNADIPELFVNSDDMNVSGSAARLQLFLARRSALRADRPEAFDMNAKDLTLEALSMVRIGMRKPDDNRHLLEWLESRLQRIEQLADSGDHAALQLARDILDLGPARRGAPSNGVQLQRAIGAFIACHDTGGSTADAEIAAFDAFHATGAADTDPTFENESKKPHVSMMTDYGSKMVSPADITLNRLRKELRKAGVLKPKPAGRPKK
ncbi:MAG: hypothetical protein RLZZ401_26 [Pseudomonadota bacterium]|jgi:hypothetical protein